jgi:hypothetical protein
MRYAVQLGCMEYGAASNCQLGRQLANGDDLTGASGISIVFFTNVFKVLMNYSQADQLASDC